MKELIEGLLFVALLKFLGVPMWLVSLGFILFLIGFFFYLCLAAFDSRIKARNLTVVATRENNKPNKSKKPNGLDKRQSPTRSGMQGLYKRQEGRGFCLPTCNENQ